MTVLASFANERCTMGYTVSSHFLSPVTLYISHAATVHIILSVEIGHAPPDPVSCMICPSLLTFFIREIIDASGWRAAMERMME